ncbi:YbaB/EbfC family DNA-binding protein [Umezawaea sp. Da 62-37]|uniref:YbaB/EbfC family DNA-binding protein n=1 Tax=Umezawaea sp. Da 62-37 TaxID=3075927 RepID=UPI0028F6FD97|nr:YbaB/EbfC family DNA-binding protein [Umezawaea sp. Da 62-37]WNV85860.1 YbaB/EbfC family DNA-binding protein [Umezawaea sp. Da 62-37]
MITANAHDPDTGVSVEVGPGGGLLDLALDARSLRLGPSGLAKAVLGLVDTATARANARVRRAVGDVSALGLGVAPRMAESVEDTTPETWRV